MWRQRVGFVSTKRLDKGLVLKKSCKCVAEGSYDACLLEKACGQST